MCSLVYYSHLYNMHPSAKKNPAVPMYNTHPKNDEIFNRDF